MSTPTKAAKAKPATLDDEEPAKTKTATKATKATKAAKPDAPPEVPAAPTINGVELSFGLVAKGGTAKEPVSAVLPRKSITIVKGFNPRKHISEESVKALAENIKKNGLLSAPTVRPDPSGDGFVLVAGERRMRAFDLLNMERVPALIRSDLDDDVEAKACALAENGDDDIRTALNPIELGRAFAEMQEKGWSLAQIAAKTGYHKSKVNRYLSIANAPKDVQEQVSTGALSVSAAEALAGLDDSTRAALKDSLHEGISAADIKAKAKELAKAEVAEVDGKRANNKTGAAKDAARQVWRGKREMGNLLGTMCASLAEAADADKETIDYYEIRGAVATLLYLRSDLDSPYLPSKDTGVVKEQKILKAFDRIVAQEAKRFREANPIEQPADSAEGGENADAAADGGDDSAEG